MFVVDLAKPTLAAVDLVAAHVSAPRDSDAADLDAAVEHTGGGIAAALDLDLELEVLETLLGADEIVVGDLLGGRAAGDGAVLDAPHLGIVIPAVEGFAVEEGNEAVGLGGEGKGEGEGEGREEQEDSEGFHLGGR